MLEPRDRRIRWQVGLGLLIFLFLLAGTTLLMLYGNGYRIGFNSGAAKLGRTGILNASSTPRGAEVYINGHPTTATNNTVNLTPGKYTIRITKEGYTSWQKDVVIKEQVVTETDAVLFPVAPGLQSISAIGIENPILDPSKTKLAFRVASESAKRNGIYILDMTSRSFPVLAVQSSATQIIDDTGLDIFSQATYTWSPDGKQLLASIGGELRTPTYYLLDTSGFNDSPRDVTAVLPSIQDTWKAQKADKERARLAALTPTLRQMIKDNFTIIEWAPDDNKILYSASTSANLPIIISPRRIGNNPLYERRDIKKGGIYVYDIQEDWNTKILDESPVVCDDIEVSCPMPLTWFPDSFHLLYVHDQKIDIVEDDGANMTTIYAGPFVAPFVYPWPDGSKIVIVTNLNNIQNPPTLYTISLR